jgi:hypothetical protein
MNAMMQKAAVAAALAVLCATAQGASAQGFGIGAHVGTTGVGGDVALGLNSHIGLHGSLGTIPMKPTATFSDLEFKIEPPKTLMTLGVDLFPGSGSFHLMGGVFTGAEETKLTGVYNGTVTIGGREYQGSELGPLTGVFQTSNAAPFVGIGLGRHTGSGFGLTLDLGVAFMGEPTLTLNDPTFNPPECAQAQQACTDKRAQLHNDIDKQRADVEDDLKKFAKLFPMLNIGIRIGM